MWMMLDSIPTLERKSIAARCRELLTTELTATLLSQAGVLYSVHLAYNDDVVVFKMGVQKKSQLTCGDITTYMRDDRLDG
jgi:hypothetical protein